MIHRNDLIYSKIDWYYKQQRPKHNIDCFINYIYLTKYLTVDILYRLCVILTNGQYCEINIQRKKNQKQFNEILQNLTKKVQNPLDRVQRLTLRLFKIP